MTQEAWTPEEVEAAGFCGRVPDPTPNENYSVKGGPTPETDEGAAAAARERREQLIAESSAGPQEQPTRSTRSTKSTSESS
jgi:hypothetical protein